jgi:hypothetical protein
VTCRQSPHTLTFDVERVDSFSVAVMVRPSSNLPFVYTGVSTLWSGTAGHYYLIVELTLYMKKGAATWSTWKQYWAADLGTDPVDCEAFAQKACDWVGCYTDAGGPSRRYCGGGLAYQSTFPYAQYWDFDSVSTASVTSV